MGNKTKLKIRCSWCGKTIGEKDREGQEGFTDGICNDCFARNFPHIYDKVKAITDERKG